MPGSGCLGLLVRGLRLQVPQSRGLVMDPVVPSTDPKEPITMTTSAEIIYHRRVRLLNLAEELGNISAACRQIGVSRTRYYEWKDTAEVYGLEALWPKDRRRPAQPNETPTHVVADLLAVAVVEPTLGCRQLADRLCELGYEIGKTTVQRILVDHGLGRRRQRIARAAAIASLAGIITEPVTEELGQPFGFCHWAGRPGDLVALDSFYIGNLKGVGKVYQLTAVDTCTRWAIVKLIIGPVTAAHTIAFIGYLTKTMRRLGIPVRRVLTDNGPEYKGLAFRHHLAQVGIDHVRIPRRRMVLVTWSMNRIVSAVLTGPMISFTIAHR
ncbi:MAG: DDE-type integrase/transposase/recombinase, partial [Actinomycetota bacterium]